MKFVSNLVRIFHLSFLFSSSADGDACTACFVSDEVYHTNIEHVAISFECACESQINAGRDQHATRHTP